MSRTRYVVLAVWLGGCYQVSDLRAKRDGSVTADAAGGGGGAAGVGAISGFGGSAGLAGAAGAITDAGEELDASGSPDAKDAADAKPDVVDAPKPVGNWLSCIDLHYKGKCLGTNTNTVMYWDEPAACSAPPYDVCWISRCSTIGADCKEDPTCGVDCDPKLDDSQVQPCSQLAGQCVDGIAVKTDSVTPGNCYYKDCAGLGAECVKKSNGADCF